MGKYRSRDIIIFIGLLVITYSIMICASLLFYNSLKESDEEIIFYNEKFNLDYKVWLKDNEFYSDKYIGEDYNVIASSIDTIEFDFNYLLNFSNHIQGISYYTINSHIIAYQNGDSSKRKIWDYKKNIKDKTITNYDVDTLNVLSKDNFKINYQEYKKLMDSYSNNYAVTLTGVLLIEIDIKSNLNYEKFHNEINLDKRTIKIEIPLTEQIVEITKKIPDNNEQTLIEKQEININYLKLSLSVFCFIGGLILIIYLSKILIQILGYDSKYVRKLHSILKNYNSIIVTVKKIELNSNEKIMYVEEFEELLDAQSELRVPILYCNIHPNKESLFALKYDKSILAYKMKSDLYVNRKERVNKFEQTK